MFCILYVFTHLGIIRNIQFDSQKITKDRIHGFEIDKMNHIIMIDFVLKLDLQSKVVECGFF